MIFVRELLACQYSHAHVCYVNFIDSFRWHELLSNLVCKYHIHLLFYFFLGIILFGFLYIITADVKWCVAAVKGCPVLHFSVIIFFWSSGSLSPALFCMCWELSTAQAGQTVREGCFTFHYPSCTESINRICNFHVILRFLILPKDNIFRIRI
jgi:hypothetical protein